MVGRKPHLVVTGGKEPRQRIWEAIRILGPAFSINDIARRSGQMPREINDFFSVLAKAGIIQLVESPDGKESRVYSLVRDEGVEYPRLNRKGERTYLHLITENIWRSIRILKGAFTADTVLHTASAGGVPMTIIRVRQYLHALAEAGYLDKTECDRNTPETYQLVPGKHTGPRPPEIRKLDSLQVYDPNLNKLVYAKTTGSIDADRSLVEPGVALLRTRDLLGEWLKLTDGGKTTVKPSPDLVQRTQLELATPGESGGLQ
ncbi:MULTISPECIES: hypothetical protein [Pseudomonas]|uniref:hypothetical protein n=1 Tax=Pseudomonas TaxID=286 RepID=UPI0006D8AD83|nr:MULTISPECIES: hypothetical protein [Pseudomonas]TWC21077.1 hypothetical protein FBY00_10389 [Pseudomonas sp. SJZ075]TWC36557.1 hypothetical protein FBY02_10389 [Pseudomonas sp. SJZ078]TWC57316.1 hypothetical protein FBY11_10389 [Pseudomonas sp. SJZ124]TWC92387.1 hypothetical protein FBY09_103195 [Pseudomonas sp. SJZ101]